MDVEIITIGDELLLGRTIDTNSAYIAHKISALGLNVRFKSSVGDDVAEIEEAIKLAVKRSGVVIATGGLGPTDDDNTKKAIVKVFQRRLVFDEKLLEDIRARYARRGIEMPAINQNQALLPSGSHIFKNKIGSAVGIGVIEKDFMFIALPGVPVEMRQIIDDEIIPFLKGKSLGRPLQMVTLRTNGIIESQLAEILSQDLKPESGVKLAYLPGESGVDLRVVGSGDKVEIVGESVRRLVSYIEKKVSKHIYGRDSDTLPSVIGQLLNDNDKTVAAAESCTGGMLGEMITTVSGSSKYFLGSIVAYANEIKERQLGVSKGLLEKHGAVSEECAVEMAVGCRRVFECDYALSITGISGPDGGSEDKPVGTTYIGLSSAHTNFARRFNFGVDRQTNRARACYAALELLRREILDID
jgi:nicotinamide-nucleotide amidase